MKLALKASDLEKLIMEDDKWSRPTLYRKLAAMTRDKQIYKEGGKRGRYCLWNNRNNQIRVSEEPTRLDAFIQSEAEKWCSDVIQSGHLFIDREMNKDDFQRRANTLFIMVWLLEDKRGKRFRRHWGTVADLEAFIHHHDKEQKESAISLPQWFRFYTDLIDEIKINSKKARDAVRLKAEI